MDSSSLLAGSPSFGDIALDETNSQAAGEMNISSGSLLSSTPNILPPSDADSAAVNSYVVRVALAHGGQLLTKYQVT